MAEHFEEQATLHFGQTCYGAGYLGWLDLKIGSQMHPVFVIVSWAEVVLELFAKRLLPWPIMSKMEL